MNYLDASVEESTVVTHPLVPPLLKIEGDDHPAHFPLLQAREEVRG